MASETIHKQISISDVYFMPGDTAFIGGLLFAGLFTLNATEMQFYVPFSKMMHSSISSVTLSEDVTWYVRHPDGGYLISGGPLSNFGTITYILPGKSNYCGVKISVKAPSSLSFTNNVPIIVQCTEARLAFS